MGIIVPTLTLFTRDSKCVWVPVQERGNKSASLSERFWKVTYSLRPYLITLQCSPKWKALSGSWGHWEVSDWHVAWHHSHVSIPRRTAEFNSLKPAVINESTTLEGKILGFTHTAVFSSRRKLNETTSDANWMSWPVGKSLYNVTCGPLVRPRQWPLRPWGGSDSQPPRCSHRTSEQFQSETSAPPQCQAPLAAWWHILNITLTDG